MALSKGGRVLYIRNVPDSKIRVAYKGVKLGVFIAIVPQNNLVLQIEELK